MQPKQEQAIVTEKSRIPWAQILVLLLLGIFLVAVFYTKSYLPQVVNTPKVENSNQAVDVEIKRIIDEGKNKKFVFNAVPDALEKVTLPNPPDSNVTDAAAYKQFKPKDLVSEGVVQNDVIFNSPLKGTTYIDYLNSLENPDKIYQITDELHELTLELNKKFNRQPIKDRLPEVEQMSVLDPIVPGEEVRSVYPSIRAVDAYGAAEIMSRIYSENRDEYTKIADSVVERGIGYGLYGKSDAGVAKSVVSQYFALYDSINGTSTDLLTNIPK